MKSIFFFILIFPLHTLEAISAEKSCDRLFDINKTSFKHKPGDSRNSQASEIILLDETGKEQGRVSYYIESPTTLSIENMHSIFPLHGVQRKLFAELLHLNPQVNRVQMGALVQDNLKIFSDHLIEMSLKKYPLKNPNPQATPTEIFQNCCGHLSQKEKEDLVREAITETPAHKVLHRLGFSKICQDPKGLVFMFFPGDPEFVVEFSACK